MNEAILILAGGQSRRMGRDKAALPLENGETMLTRLVHRFGRNHRVWVSVGQPGHRDTAGAPELVDLHPGQGPLAGLEAALTAEVGDLILLTGTDLPFLSEELAEAVLACARTNPGYDAWVLFRENGEPEPLCAVYGGGCRGAVEACLSEGRRSFRHLYSKLKVFRIEEAQLGGFCLSHELDNLNTPEDLERVGMKLK